MLKKSKKLVPVISLTVVPVDLAPIERLSGQQLLSPDVARRIEPWTPEDGLRRCVTL